MNIKKLVIAVSCMVAFGYFWPAASAADPIREEVISEPNVSFATQAARLKRAKARRRKSVASRRSVGKGVSQRSRRARKTAKSRPSRHRKKAIKEARRRAVTASYIRTSRPQRALAREQEAARRGVGSERGQAGEQEAVRAGAEVAGRPIIRLVRGDITTQPFDKSKKNTIVSAMNVTMNYTGAGGVAGVIGNAAGRDQLTKALTEKKGYPGCAFVSPSFGLKERGVDSIIHAVGPDCGNKLERLNRKKLLSDVYRNIFRLAATIGTHVIYIPSISTVIFRCDPHEATTIAVAEAAHFLRSASVGSIQEIIFVAFDPTMYDMYRRCSTEQGVGLTLGSQKGSKQGAAAARVEGEAKSRGIYRVMGDITQQHFDKNKINAIVSASDVEMDYLRAKTVAGDIGNAAGRDLLTKALAGRKYQPGDVVVTEGFRMKERGVGYIIHVVGPDCRDKSKSEYKNRIKLLEDVYRNIFKQAEKMGVQVLYIPSISTGRFACNKHQASCIAVKEAARFFDVAKSIQKIIFVLFDEEMYRIYVRCSEQMAIFD